MDHLHPSSTDPLIMNSSNEESPQQFEQKNQCCLSTTISSPQHIHFRIGKNFVQNFVLILGQKSRIWVP